MFIFSSAQLAAATIFLFLVKLISGNNSPEIALKNEAGFCVSKTLALQYQREICCLELEMVHPKTGSCISPCALKHQALRYDLDGFLACVCTSPFKLIHDEYLENKKMCGCLSPTGKAYGTIFHDGEDICCVGEPIRMGKKGSKCKPNDRVNSHKVCPYLSRWDEMSGECLCNIAGQVKVGGVCRCENVGHMIDPSNTKCVSRCKPFQRWDARLNTCVCAGELVQAGRLGILKCAKKTEITCRTHEYFNGKLCICEDGYWRASELDECQIKPTCGPREVRNRQTNMCQCKPEHSRWSSNVCLPTCSIEHTQRVSGEDYACECVQGYTWKDYDQTSCKPLPMCGNKERYDGVFTFRCICIANYERLGEFGCQPKCVTSNSRRVKPATNTNTAVVDEGCECISGYHWNDPSSVARKSCHKNPVCGVFEYFDGRLCACLTGYWRDSDGKKCKKEKEPKCGPRESHDKPTNSCLCDQGYERWENNACLPICGLKHSHRIGKADDACSCKSGYSWDSGLKSSCVKAFPNGQWPVSRGKKTFSSVHIVKSGEIFDGGMYTYDRSDIKCDRRGTWRDAVFRVEAGGILKNVLIGKNQREGVHCSQSDCILQEIWWMKVCDNALSVKGGSSTSVARLIGGGAMQAGGKLLISHTGAGLVSIEDFYAKDFGRLYTSCPKSKCDCISRHVKITNTHLARPSISVVTVNQDQGDTAKILSLEAESLYGKPVCVTEHGQEGPHGTVCQYDESDITVL